MSNKEILEKYSGKLVVLFNETGRVFGFLHINDNHFTVGNQTAPIELIKELTEITVDESINSARLGIKV